MVVEDIHLVQTRSEVNPKFLIEFEAIGKVGEFVSNEFLREAERFVGFCVDLLNVDSFLSKYKRLMICFEVTESPEYDGMTFDSPVNPTLGVIKIFLYKKLEDLVSFLTTISHELIHIKQFSDERLSRQFRRVDGDIVGCYKWSDDGRYYLEGDVEEEYDSLPWEIEAQGFQSVLVNLYRDFLLSKKIPLLF